jgi:quinol monooxygenase YgiN
MAVSAVITFRVRDGRLGEQLENLKEVKRMVERAGGTFRVHRQLFGSQMNSIVAVSEYKDWAGFAKIRSDKEFTQFVEKIRASSNPASDFVGGDLYEDVQI